MPRLYQLAIFIFFLPLVSVGQIVFEQQHSIPVTDDGKSLQNPWIGGLNSGQYNKADLDGDGVEELIVYDRSSDTYEIFKMENDKFFPSNELHLLLPDIPAGWVLFVDYDGDGKKDIFSNGQSGAMVYKNIGASGQPVQWEKVADPLFTTGFSGKINLIINSSDVPAITDIDGDGDVDILVYDFAIGGYIRYNKNLSMELFGNADSLEYEIATRSWGEFAECACNDFAFGGSTCADNNNGRVMHAGGKALLAIDTDGDGDKDLLAGHEQCEELYFFENMGDADSAYMMDYSNQFPNAANPANFYLFPTAYFEDIDFDGVKDLLVTPGFAENYGFKIDFAQSNWMYKNTGTDTNPEFIFQQKDFMQNEMIDFGENASPVFFDFDADGKTDILIAANGFWNGDNFNGYVITMKNTGTTESPEFEITDKNYLDLASLNLLNPTLGLVDFNGDSALDLVYTGTQPQNLKPQSWLLANQSPKGQPASFDLSGKQEISLPGSLASGDSPTFFDVDANGQVDLLVGKKSGALEYYGNTGEQFTLVNAEFLGIGRDFSLEKINLVASVTDLDGNGLADLTTTDYRGIGQVYFDFQLNTNGTPDPVPLVYKNGITNKEEPLSFDTKSWISGADVFSFGTQSIVVGGSRGGLQLFKNTTTNEGGNGQKSMEVRIFPNPLETSSDLNIYANQNVTIELLTILGQEMLTPFQLEKFTNTAIHIGHLPNGSYIIKSTNTSGAISSQLLIISK